MEIAAHLRGSSHFPARSPSVYPPQFAHPSPTVHSMGSPSVSTPTANTHPTPLMVDTNHTPTPGGSASNMMVRHRDSIPNAYQSPPLSAPGHRGMNSANVHSRSAHSSAMYSQQGQGQGLVGAHGTTLPPFSSLESMGPPRSQPSNVSSMRFQQAEHRQRLNGPETATGSKRSFPTSSTVTSADSTDVEEDDGELPAPGLVAPWEVLRGLADVAIERAAQVRRQSHFYGSPFLL